MNGAHFHLVVNHLPIIFPIVGVILMITGFVSKSEAIKRSAFMLFVFTSLATIVAMKSGEGAEEVVEHIQGVDHHFIHEHEEIAELFAKLSLALGVISLVGLWASFKQKSFSTILALIVLIYSFVVIFFAKETGTSGGEIRHTEIRENK